MLKKTDKESERLEDKVTNIVATSLDQGHYGWADCGNCGAPVPEPYYKQKKCSKCNYSFSGIKKCDYPFGGPPGL